MLPTRALQDYEQLPAEEKSLNADENAPVEAEAQAVAGYSFGAIKVKKQATLEQMDEAVRERGGRL
uniref:Uncharacterized protein n=1 Tax=uncultured Thiotrichaceae bacterium TaxID=298394 RepID=A0A6S6TLD6_9GAMM|nr:MAG: Unknown protein [uncultured Thiotrichaceae bacterium]